MVVPVAGNDLCWINNTKRGEGRREKGKGKERNEGKEEMEGKDEVGEKREREKGYMYVPSNSLVHNVLLVVCN